MRPERIRISRVPLDGDWPVGATRRPSRMRPNIHGRGNVPTCPRSHGLWWCAHPAIRGIERDLLCSRCAVKAASPSRAWISRPPGAECSPPPLTPSLSSVWHARDILRLGRFRSSTIASSWLRSATSTLMPVRIPEISIPARSRNPETLSNARFYPLALIGSRGQRIWCSAHKSENPGDVIDAKSEPATSGSRPSLRGANKCLSFSVAHEPVPPAVVPTRSGTYLAPEINEAFSGSKRTEWLASPKSGLAVEFGTASGMTMQPNFWHLTRTPKTTRPRSNSRIDRRTVGRRARPAC